MHQGLHPITHRPSFPVKFARRSLLFPSIGLPTIGDLSLLQVFLIILELSRLLCSPSLMTVSVPFSFFLTRNIFAVPERDAIQFFQPQYSAEATSSFMILPDYFRTSEDGTITSLRREILRDDPLPALECPDGETPMDANQADCSQAMLASPPSTQRTLSTSLDQVPTTLDPSNLSNSQPDNAPEKLSIKIPTTPPSPCGSCLSPLTPLSDFDDDDLQSREDHPGHDSARTLRKRKAKPLYAPLPKRTRRKSTNVIRVKIEWPEKIEGDDGFRSKVTVFHSSD
jgi:hypothetical protein